MTNNFFQSLFLSAHKPNNDSYEILSNKKKFDEMREKAIDVEFVIIELDGKKLIE